MIRIKIRYSELPVLDCSSCSSNVNTSSNRNLQDIVSMNCVLMSHTKESPTFPQSEIPLWVQKHETFFLIDQVLLKIQINIRAWRKRMRIITHTTKRPSDVEFKCYDNNEHIEQYSNKRTTWMMANTYQYNNCHINANLDTSDRTLMEHAIE